MDFLESIQLGTYNPIWKAITVFHENIADVEKRNPNILRHLVTFHENYHWLQLNTTSLGHVISLFPFFYKNVVSTYYDFNKSDRNFSVIKPLMPQACAGNSTADNILVHDIRAIDIVNKFLGEAVNLEEWLTQGNEINQGLFGIYDMYLMYSKHILVNLYGRNKYQEFVETNRKFWDRQENYGCTFYKKDIPLLGFRDLVECAARIVEIKYYRNIVENYSSIEVDARIDDEYLYNNQQYFEPLKYIQEIFAHDCTTKNMDSIFQFLLLAIHVSINPPVVPFFEFAWRPTVSINDIHPGIRFIRLCIKVREIYGSCVKASKDIKLYSNICAAMSWPDDKLLFSSLQNTYSEFLSKIGERDDGRSMIPNSLLYEFDFYLYKYCKYNSIKAKNTEYFIDPVKFISSKEKLPIAIEVDTNIHCPVLFDTEVNKFRVNVSGFNFEFLNEKGEIVETISTMKEMSDAIQQEFLNLIILGIFYKLDNQLLYDNGAFDLSIFNQIDAPHSLKEEILAIYNNARGLKLSLY